MSDFVGELLGSREYADLANRLYRLGDGLRAKLLSDAVKATHSHTALIFFFGRCFKTYQASIELLRLGFGQDTAVLARTLREAEYQVGWIMEGGDETAQLFFQDYNRNKRKIMRTLAKHGDPEIKAQAQQIADATTPDATLDEWWKNWWSKKWNEGIGWLAGKLGRTAHRWEYATLSAFVHTSPALLDFYFHEKGDGTGVILESRPGVSENNRGASPVRCSIALPTTFTSSSSTATASGSNTASAASVTINRRETPDKTAPLAARPH